jgi:gamma-glutamylcyclotransferase (GGCT)/AIG2-like uncharacterized protein YtfP
MTSLFSYGTLQDANVQMATFGRYLKGKPDQLPAYRLNRIRITDEAVLRKSNQEFHPVGEFTGNPVDVVTGMVFEVEEHELEQADAYEVSDYKRIRVILASGTTSWVYVSSL